MSTKVTKFKYGKYKNLSKLKNYEFDDRYVCDDKGNIYLVIERKDDICTGKPLAPFTTKDGYTEYVLTAYDGTKKHIQAHRVVAGLYLPTVIGKDFVNHKDGNKSNNSVTNLKYTTHAENIQHTYDKLGRTGAGGRRPNSK